VVYEKKENHIKIARVWQRWRHLKTFSLPDPAFARPKPRVFPREIQRFGLAPHPLVV